MKLHYCSRYKPQDEAVLVIRAVSSFPSCKLHETWHLKLVEGGGAWASFQLQTLISLKTVNADLLWPTKTFK